MEDNLFDRNIFVVKTALCMIYEERIKVSKDLVFKVLLQRGLELDSYHFRSLAVVTNKEDFNACIILLKKFKLKKSLESILTEVLFDLTTVDNWRILYNLIQGHEKSQIRLFACKLLVKFNHLDELNNFTNDVDGHIRTFVKKHASI